jgi:hypothetical protein
MTQEELALKESQVIEWFDKYDNEYLEDHLVPAECRLHPDRTLDSYLRIYSLTGGKRFSIEAEHDVIYLAALDNVLEKITEQDVADLRRLGIHYDADSQCLADFA